MKPKKLWNKIKPAHISPLLFYFVGAMFGSSIAVATWSRIIINSFVYTFVAGAVYHFIFLREVERK